MKTARILAAFAAALVLVGGAAYALGVAVGPVDVEQPGPEAPHGDSGGHGTAGDHAVASAPVGLSAWSGGYALVPTTTTLPAGAAQPFSFRVTGPGGRTVTDFEVAHEKELHLIVVRRDTAGYQHVHPVRAADGIWSVPLELTQPGSYRVFADFVPRGGSPLTLGVDVMVPGEFQPIAPKESWLAKVDGYEVRIGGDLIAGHASKLTATVTKDGRPVADLQPYLGAYGHMVALRGGDLAYLHVHAETGAPGPEVAFVAEVPSEGTYRVFLDFKHGEVVRTAEFTLTTSPEHGADGHTHG
ncbi:hypothetical protein SAMN05192558_11295 [Actinokineospora alba]|uniref:Heavy-metal-associated domain-containing protein n=1 Tax=Actinokineospora alba TaxID=504798 RepID=A0A1H0UVC4_9PSEU|nr:hypothetical protein [Actinokineospora alba]TDP69033.1 hypothetical protein C8E96_4604 [Actinokineospora alba]SDI77994.1 hypothetical protein SAMN05421871_107309 [Actinokineospora alba]SDP70130.1 hypothetical protein SAMN05192558_11295 [Actinokineospora alba]